jgi:plastocyanin
MARSSTPRSSTSILCGIRGLLAVTGTVVTALAGAKDLHVHTTMDRTFSPREVRAMVGDRIIWTNNSRVRHEIAFSANPSDSGERNLTRQLPPDRTVAIKVTRPGIYDYACRWHGMWGRIVVEDRHER